MANSGDIVEHTNSSSVVWIRRLEKRNWTSPIHLWSIESIEPHSFVTFHVVHIPGDWWLLRFPVGKLTEVFDRAILHGCPYHRRATCLSSDYSVVWCVFDLGFFGLLIRQLLIDQWLPLPCMVYRRGAKSMRVRLSEIELTFSLFIVSFFVHSFEALYISDQKDYFTLGFLNICTLITNTTIVFWCYICNHMRHLGAKSHGCRFFRNPNMIGNW